MSEQGHEDSSSNFWLPFFFVCYFLTMLIGGVAIFTYHCNEPEHKQAAGH